MESFQDEDEETKKSSRYVAYKSLYFLGDIARYRAQYSAGSKTWLESWIWYEKAFTLHPIGAKPHTQLGILSIYKQNHVDVLYYNCLALGNKESNPIPRNHLKSFLSDQEGMATLRSTANFPYFVECTLKLFAALYSGDFHPDFIDYMITISSNVEFMVFQDLVVVSKLMTSFIILHEELDKCFSLSVDASTKQKYRNCQVICFGYMLVIAKRSLGMLNEQVNHSENMLIVECAVPVGNFCTWVQLHKSVLSQYISYGFILNQNEFEAMLIGFSRYLALFVNCISAFADMDGSTEYCSSDHHLIALKSFDPFFEEILQKKHVIIADLRLTQYARIGHFAKNCADDPNIGFISFQRQESIFVVRDSGTKVIKINFRKKKFNEQ
jgi:hypothetical protein